VELGLSSGGLKGGRRSSGLLRGPVGLKTMTNQKTIFVILSAAKNLSSKAAEILHSAALRSE